MSIDNPLIWICLYCLAIIAMFSFLMFKRKELMTETKLNTWVYVGYSIVYSLFWPILDLAKFVHSLFKSK
jgi:tryptophan-rich sensory protein